MGDLKRAGVERVDHLRRVVHFHSFRKTWQTLGVRYGINQRVAQEVLGHSDANLTAKVYTDVPALALHAEIAKLPWIDAGKGGAAAVASNGQASADSAVSDAATHTSLPSAQVLQPVSSGDTQQRTQGSGVSGPPTSLGDLVAQVVQLVKVSSPEDLRRDLALDVTSADCDKMAARAGIEPATK